MMFKSKMSNTMEKFTQEKCLTILGGTIVDACESVQIFNFKYGGHIMSKTYKLSNLIIPNTIHDISFFLPKNMKRNAKIIL